MNDFSSKCEILGDLWLNYRDEDDFTDFIEYNDIGLPLAYTVSAGLATATPQGELYINETWDLLVEALGIDGEETWDSLDHMLDSTELED
jgi:hypothetical protein